MHVACTTMRILDLERSMCYTRHFSHFGLPKCRMKMQSQQSSGTSEAWRLIGNGRAGPELKAIQALLASRWFDFVGNEVFETGFQKTILHQMKCLDEKRPAGCSERKLEPLMTGVSHAVAWYVAWKRVKYFCDTGVLGGRTSFRAQQAK